MKNLIIFFFLILEVSNLYSVPRPVNPKASKASKEVLSAIYKIKNQGKLIMAQHIREKTSDIFSEKSEYKHIFNVTGKYPAILGVDFYQSPEAAVSSAIQQWERGGLVTLTWHQSSPAVAYQGDWKSVQSKMTEEEFRQLITPGTELYNKWLDHIDRMAQHLKTLKDKGVVVLWRPYHEMNGGWFWWGKKGTEFRRMWINMYNRYTNYHKLDNLIWIFGPNIGVEDPAIYYPGHKYVDIGGFDIYNSTRKLDTSQHDKLKILLNGKPIAMTETGLLPRAEEMISKSDYLWFMPWHSSWCDNSYYGMPGANGPGNSADILKEFYLHPAAVTLENLSQYYKKVKDIRK